MAMCHVSTCYRLGRVRELKHFYISTFFVVVFLIFVYEYAMATQGIDNEKNILINLKICINIKPIIANRMTINKI